MTIGKQWRNGLQEFLNLIKPRKHVTRENDWLIDCCLFTPYRQLRSFHDGKKYKQYISILKRKISGVGWATSKTVLEGHWKKGVMGRDWNLAFVAAPNAPALERPREVRHSPNTVPTNGPRLGFPYYDPSTPGAFTAEGIPLSATWGRAWLLCGSSCLPQVNTSRHTKTLRRILCAQMNNSVTSRFPLGNVAYKRLTKTHGGIDKWGGVHGKLSQPMDYYMYYLDYKMWFIMLSL